MTIRQRKGKDGKKKLLNTYMVFIKMLNKIRTNLLLPWGTSDGALN